MEDTKLCVHMRIQHPLVGHQPAVEHKSVRKQQYDCDQYEKEVNDRLSDNSFYCFFLFNCHTAPTYWF